jgi:hypothetical protein
MSMPMPAKRKVLLSCLYVHIVNGCPSEASGCAWLKCQAEQYKGFQQLASATKSITLLAAELFVLFTAKLTVCTGELIM